MKFHLEAAETPLAQKTKAAVEATFVSVPAEEADVVVVLGGDGFMLSCLHKFIGSKVPLYGINCGTVGFLLNRREIRDLEERIQAARSTPMIPLCMRVTRMSGEVVMAPAFNEVSVTRAGPRSARLRIWVDGAVQMPELRADGVLVATPAGSTGYNVAAGGPIIPLGSPLLALTPICPIEPRGWRGALLPDGARITLEVLGAEEGRPAKAVADWVEVQDVVSVEIMRDPSQTVTLLFDPAHNLEARLIQEQFR